MSKEKVFIVLMHKNKLRDGQKKGTTPAWEVEERVEFVNQLRDKHYQFASAIGNYLDRTMVMGARYGMDVYEDFENYIRTKYKEQMNQLDAAYGREQKSIDTSP